MEQTNTLPTLQVSELPPSKIKNAHWYKRVLNKLCLDERLSPNRRLLAAILGMQMDAETMMDKKAYTAILVGTFVNRNGVQLYDNEDIRNGPDPRTNIEQKADEEVRDVFTAILGIDVNRKTGKESG